MTAAKELGKLVELFQKLSCASLDTDDLYQFEFREIINLMASLAVTHDWNVDKTVEQFFADRNLPYRENYYNPQWILAKIHEGLGLSQRGGYGNLMFEKDQEVNALNERFFQFDMEGKEAQAVPFAPGKREKPSLKID